nr:MAG TPA: hypothetical protein [Caudoviricetes sp.]
MYAPKRIFFFDFDKLAPRLATRWGGLLSLRALCIYATCAAVRVQRRGCSGEKLFPLNRYVRAINMYVRMKHQYEV